MHDAPRVTPSVPATRSPWTGDTIQPQMMASLRDAFALPDMMHINEGCRAQPLTTRFDGSAIHTYTSRPWFTHATSSCPACKAIDKRARSR